MAKGAPARERPKLPGYWIAILALAVALVASTVTNVVLVLGLTQTGDTSFMEPTDPPDGDAQRAWITVPSKNTKPGAMIVDVHVDYQCPICKLAENAFADAFARLSDRGDIVLRYHTRTFLDGNLRNDSSTRAAIAAACVDVADSTKYAAYHAAIFASQPSEGVGFSDQQLRLQFANTAGLKGKALTKFQTCYDSRATATWVKDVETNSIGTAKSKTSPPLYLYGGNDPLYYDAQGQMTDAANGTQSGVHSTPTIYVNGKPLSLGALFTVSGNDTVPRIGTDADSLFAVLRQVA